MGEKWSYLNDNPPKPLEIVTAEITGFRYYTSRNTGRTYIVGDYITSKGDTSFDAVEKLVPLKIRRRRAR